MDMLSNEKINFKSLEENTFKEMMKLGRKIIQDEIRMLDKLILNYRDKEIFKPKDFQPTTIKTKLGEIPIARRRYKMLIIGYKEEQLEEIKEKLPSLGLEESHMYCVCRDRMKKNRTSWSVIGAEALLKVIMNKMNGTIVEIITNKAEKKIKEELANRIPEPKIVKKKKESKIIYAGRYEIGNNFTGRTKQHVLDILRDKKCSELMLIS